MRGRVYFDPLIVGPLFGGWYEIDIPEPVTAALRVPMLGPEGIGAIELRLLAVEHDVAVYA